MRAIAVHDIGNRPALIDLPQRDPEPAEIVVEVHASSVNGFDIAVLSGWIREFMEYRFPVVPGKDFAGTVVAVGPGESPWAVGDAVFGVLMTPHVGSDGGFADYVTVDFAKGANSTLAHELAHACNLTHTDEGLMGPPAGRTPHLSPWQITKLRMSRHVVYF